MVLARLLILLPLLVGCKKAVEAPEELAELSAWIYTEYENEDPEVLSTGIEALRDFALAEIDLSGGWEDRGFEALDTFSRADVKELVRHRNDPKDAVGVGLFYKSSHRSMAHMEIIGLRDQTPVEPSSPDHYIREFIESTPACMKSRECTLLRSLNDVHRDNLLYSIEYEMEKDWRWVEIESGTALVARSWNLDENSNEGSVRLLQGYSLDIYMPGPGGTIRYQTVWQQTEVPGTNDEKMAPFVLKGIDEQLSHHDAWLDGER